MQRKRWIALLALALLLVSFVGCAGDQVEEDEIFPAARALIEESKVLNELYFGEGIPVRGDVALEGVYAQADRGALQEMGFEGIADIREKTKQVFSPSMCSWLFGRAFSAESTGTGVSLARYYEKSDQNNTLMVLTTAEVYLNGAVTYDYSTMKIKGQHRDTVELTLEATVTTEAGLSRKETITVKVIKESDGWRLDSPTYLVYASYPEIG